MNTPRASKLTPIHILVLLYWGIAIAATALSPVKWPPQPGLVKLTLYLLVFALVERVVRSPRWRSWLSHGLSPYRIDRHRLWPTPMVLWR